MTGWPSGVIMQQPEKQPSASTQPGVGTRAGGRCSQCTRSELTAWPQICSVNEKEESGDVRKMREGFYIKGDKVPPERQL